MALEQGDEAAPRASNLQAADVLAAAHAMGAIMAALWRRPAPGRARTSTSRCWRPSWRRQRDLRLGAQRRRGARQPAPGHDRAQDRRPLHGDADRGGTAALAALARAHEAAGAGRGSALRHRVDAPPALARAARHHHRVARHVPQRGRGARRARRGAHPLRAGAAPGRGHRHRAPGHARLLSGAAPSGPFLSARDGQPVSPGRAADAPPRAGRLPRGPAHPPRPPRSPRLQGRAHRGAHRGGRRRGPRELPRGSAPADREEIVAEKAATLGRAGERLETALRLAAEFARRLAGSTRGEARSARARATAMRGRGAGGAPHPDHQREAIGLRNIASWISNFRSRPASTADRAEFPLFRA